MSGSSIPGGVLECSRAQLLRDLGREDEALGELARIEREYAGDAAPPHFAREFRADIDPEISPRLV